MSNASSQSSLTNETAPANRHILWRIWMLQMACAAPLGSYLAAHGGNLFCLGWLPGQQPPLVPNGHPAFETCWMLGAILGILGCVVWGLLMLKSPHGKLSESTPPKRLLITEGIAKAAAVGSLMSIVLFIDLSFAFTNQLDQWTTANKFFTLTKFWLAFTLGGSAIVGVPAGLLWYLAVSKVRSANRKQSEFKPHGTASSEKQ